MASFNKVILAGNLTRDPELRVTPKGTAICQFGLAINRKFKDESGQQRDDTTFVDCEAWGKTAELISKYLTKGKQALVEGRLKLDTWEDKQTQQKRSKLKVVVENVQFLSAATPSEQTGGQSSAPTSERQQPPTQENIDEDVPF
jgi:single-strand DNA-binding protein